MAKVEIRVYHVMDIYYNESDMESVEALIEEYKAKGWSDENYDYGHREFDSCVQLTKYNKRKRKKLKSINQ